MFLFLQLDTNERAAGKAGVIDLPIGRKGAKDTERTHDDKKQSTNEP